MAKEIHAKGGVKGFYAGLDAALLRQVVYGTLRLGIYSNAIDYFKKQNADPTTTTFAQKAQSSFVAGCLGSWVGNPMDLVLVRMQADTSLPAAERRNYSGVGDAFKRIMAEEGMTSLWVGAIPTMIRATALNMSMMMTYDTVKENLTAMYGNNNPFKIQAASSMLAAINVALITLPFDNIKTKIQAEAPPLRHHALQKLHGLLPPEHGQGGRCRFLVWPAHLLFQSGTSCYHHPSRTRVVA